MKKNHSFKRVIFALPAFILLIFMVIFFKEEIREIFSSEDVYELSTLERVQQRGKLIALVDYNSTNYFIYRGEPMGYQFELLKAFAEHLDVKLEIVTNNDLNESFKSLQDQKVDLIAIGLTVTKERNEIVDFSDPLGETRQMLVQRKPENWRKMETMDEIEEQLIRNPIQLAGKTIVIQKSPLSKKD